MTIKKITMPVLKTFSIPDIDYTDDSLFRMETRACAIAGTDYDCCDLYCEDCICDVDYRGNLIEYIKIQTPEKKYAVKLSGGSEGILLKYLTISEAKKWNHVAGALCEECEVDGKTRSLGVWEVKPELTIDRK